MPKTTFPGPPSGQPPSGQQPSGQPPTDTSAKENFRNTANMISVLLAGLIVPAYPEVDETTDKRLTTGKDSRKHKHTKSRQRNTVEIIVRFGGLMMLLCLCLSGSDFYPTFNLEGSSWWNWMPSWASTPMSNVFTSTAAKTFIDSLMKPLACLIATSWFVLVWTCGAFTTLIFVILECLEASNLAVPFSFYGQVRHDLNTHCLTQIGNSFGEGIVIPHTLPWKGTTCAGLATVLEADDANENIFDLFTNSKYRPVLNTLISKAQEMTTTQKDACAKVQQQRIDVRLWKATTTHKPDVTVKENCKSSVTQLAIAIKPGCSALDVAIWPDFTLDVNVPEWSIDDRGQLASKVPDNCFLNEQFITVECSVMGKARNVTYEPFCPSACETCNALKEHETEYHACSSMNAQQCQFLNCVQHLQAVQTVSRHQTGVCKIWNQVGWVREVKGSDFFLPKPEIEVDYMQLKSNEIMWIVPTVCLVMLWSFYEQTPVVDRNELRQEDRGLKGILVSAFVFICIGVLVLRKIT